jgi:hypothetical protein
MSDPTARVGDAEKWEDFLLRDNLLGIVVNNRTKV